jgi:hypothetical protein
MGGRLQVYFVRWYAGSIAAKRVESSARFFVELNGKRSTALPPGRALQSVIRALVDYDSTSLTN